jgi:hypothetical protein
MASFVADVTMSGSIEQGNAKISIVQKAEATTPPDIEEPPIDPPPSGNGWTPPDYLLTDTRTYPMPNTSKPRYLEQTREPTFGTKLIRVTGDPGDAIPGISGARWGDQCRHHYNTDQAWNCDGSLLYLDLNSGGSGLCLDGESYEPRFEVKNIPSNSDVRWHGSDPDFMIYAADRKLGGWNPRTGEVLVRKDFGSAYSGLLIGPWEGALSTDGAMVVLTGRKDGVDMAFAYNISTGIKSPDVMTSSVGNAGNDWDARISSKGNYIVWGFDPDIHVITDLNGAIIHTLPKNYASHGDVMTDGNGDEVIVARSNGAPSNVPGGLVGKWRLRDGRFTMLSTGGYASHTSARYQRDYCVSASFADGGPPYLSEIYMCALDGSKVYRLVHHHSTEQDYVAQPQPSHSRDGGRVIFASDWGASGSRVGCYIVDFRT